MGLTNREKQKAHRERLAAKGIISLSVEVPRKVAEGIAAEAKAHGKTRNQVAVDRLSAKPKAVAGPLPKAIKAEATRIVRLIGEAERTCRDQAASEALLHAMDAIYGLADMAARQPRTKRGG